MIIKFVPDPSFKWPSLSVRVSPVCGYTAIWHYVVNVVLYFISAYHVFDRERYVNETKLSKFHENFYRITWYALKKTLSCKVWNLLQNKSSRFFENQPNDICSHLSEKASKGRFLEPEELQNHSNEGKGKEKKKARGEGKEEKKKKQWLHS